MPASISEFLGYMAKLRPTTSCDLNDQIVNTLGDSVLELSKTHNTLSTKFVFRVGANTFLMKAEFGVATSNTVAHELSWYTRHRLQPMGRLFVAGRRYETWSCVILDYINSSSSLDELVYGDSLPYENIVSSLSRSVEYDNDMFNKGKIVKKTVSATRDTYHQKITRRIKALGINKPELFELLLRDTLIINGRPFISPLKHVDKILSRGKYEALLPLSAGNVHGDLHAGNILLSTEDVYWVDPNGRNLLSIEYDYGKILHSLDGYHGIITDRFSLSGNGQLGFEFALEIPHNYRKYLKVLEQTWSEHMFLSALFNEAVHFLTMLPHHMAKEKETTAILIQSYLLFDKLRSYAL